MIKKADRSIRQLMRLKFLRAINCHWASDTLKGSPASFTQFTAKDASLPGNWADSQENTSDTTLALT
jgi:hypothetical protein